MRKKSDSGGEETQMTSEKGVPGIVSPEEAPSVNHQPGEDTNKVAFCDVPLTRGVFLKSAASLKGVLYGASF